LAALLHEVTLDKLTYGGDALGRLADGRAVFVRFALPGERVRIELTQEKEHFARGKLIEVVQPAPERIAPRCKHFGICGGCHYQHMPYEMQLSAKADILRDQLTRIGQIASPPVQGTVPSPQPWNYRNQVQFHLTPDGKLGYARDDAQAAAAPDVFAIEECHLPEEPINELWPRLELEATSGVQRVAIRAGSNAELMLALESSAAALPELEVEAGISVAHILDRDCVVLAGEDHVVMRVSGREFQVSAQAFFQVNTAVAEMMVQHVLAHVPDSSATVIDAYCGVGLFSAFLSGRCKRLIGIESSPAACHDFELNLEEFDNVELYEDLAEHALPALDIRAEVVLVDPPRAGLARAALDAIVKSAPRMLIYVSCDPATLARDLRRLIEAGYRLLKVTPFDLFPQTYHIESISILER